MFNLFFNFQPTDADLLAFDIVAPWNLMPFAALMRAAPSKGLGLALAFVAMASPLAAAWSPGARLRRASTWLLWALCCAMLPALWIMLGFLGAQAPDDRVVAQSQIVGGAYLLLFLLAPPLLARSARPAA
jgi:hypothetical protein